MNPLITDLYQLTMSQGYWMNNISERRSVFNLYFRKNPFKGEYAIACGLNKVFEFINNFKFTSKDIKYLKSLKGVDDKPLFQQEFLTYLGEMKFSCDIFAVPEGTIVFKDEPLLRVEGPIVQCQIMESFLLHAVNFQTLIATKASRIVSEANGDPVIEFGLRRAQNPLDASYAAYVGGCSATSNVEAGRTYGIPVKGTHAHSWVMSFENELTAFEKYAESAPNNCILLVDTYDPIKGVENAIKVGNQLKEKGHALLGIRLDSGDLCELSKTARNMLDEAGFKTTLIVASNDLDENAIKRLKKKGAKIDIWGIGTKLSTSYDQPALGGVYKLSAIENDNGELECKMKLGTNKRSFPGVVQVKRVWKKGKHLTDFIYDINTPHEDLEFFYWDEESSKEDKWKWVNLKESGFESEDLLSKFVENGRILESPCEEYEEEEIKGIHSARKRTIKNMNTFDFTLERYGLGRMPKEERNYQQLVLNTDRRLKGENELTWEKIGIE